MHQCEERGSFKMKKRFLWVLAGLLLLPLTACGGPDPNSLVSLNGSTSMDQVVNILNEQFMLDHSGFRATYDPTGSGAGIQAVKTGICDIGLSSRALREGETDAGLTGTILALDGIAVVVNPENPVSELTGEQLLDIYTAAIQNWADVGGGDAPISAVGREAGSGTREGFETAAGVNENAAYAQELTSTGAVLEAVRTNPNAIGYVSLASLSNAVRALSIDGAACTEEEILDGSYPIQRPFLLVTRTDEPLSSAAQAWFDFATGPDAADLIRKAGAIPVAR